MSQRSEKYARSLGRMQRMQGVKLEELGGRVKQIEDREWCWLETVGQDKKEVDQLRERVFSLEREQRRREVSRGRIALLCGTVAVCAVLLWLSLSIFGMV